jgi:hypothetical protein
MAMRVETNPLEAAYAVLLEHGLDGAGEALRILVNEAAKVERSEFLGAAPYERTVTRRDYANDLINGVRHDMHAILPSCQRRLLPKPTRK